MISHWSVEHIFQQNACIWTNVCDSYRWWRNRFLAPAGKNQWVHGTRLKEKSNYNMLQ